VIEKVEGLCNNFVNLGVALASRLGVWRSEKPPNKACSGQGFALRVRGGFPSNGSGWQGNLPRPPCR